MAPALNSSRMRDEARQNLDARRLNALARIIALLAAAHVAACGEDPATVSDRPTASSPPRAAHRISWLEVETNLAPAQWLASREEETLRPPTDPEVQHVRRLLDEAHRLYGESPRMIANRTVQIEAMLRAKGYDDRAIAILQDLAHVPGAPGRTEGYGAIAQHYVNLRSEGLGREAALAALTRLYGKHSQK